MSFLCVEIKTEFCVSTMFLFMQSTTSTQSFVPWIRKSNLTAMHQKFHHSIIKIRLYTDWDLCVVLKKTSSSYEITTIKKNKIAFEYEFLCDLYLDFMRSQSGIITVLFFIIDHCNIQFCNFVFYELQSTYSLNRCCVSPSVVPPEKSERRHQRRG